MPPRPRRRRGLWWVLRLPTKRWILWGQRAVGLLAISLYAYVAWNNPSLLQVVPPLSPTGTSLPRVGALWLGQESLPAATGLGMDGTEQCGVVPVTFSRPPMDRLYGVPAEADLPWADGVSAVLRQRMDEAGTDRMISAFRITLPDPLWDEAHNVALAAEYLRGLTVAPGASVSLLETIGPFTTARGYGDGPTYVGGHIKPTIAGGVCKIATAVYNAVIYADLHVLERQPHSMSVPYVPAGRDAAVAWGYKDLRFQNKRDVPVVLWAEMQNNTLYVAMYSRYDPPAVLWDHEELNRQKTWIIRRPMSDMMSGEERVVIQGLDGVTVRTRITVYYPDEEPEQRVLSVDAYAPLPEIVEYGPR